MFINSDINYTYGLGDWVIISSLTERTEAQGFCSESLRGGFRANCYPADAGNGDDIVEDGIIILLYTPGCPIGAYCLT